MLTIKIQTDNAAFGGHPDSVDEINRILLELTGRLADGQLDGTLRDISGNRVGEFHLDSI